MPRLCGLKVVRVRKAPGAARNGDIAVHEELYLPMHSERLFVRKQSMLLDLVTEAFQPFGSSPASGLDRKPSPLKRDKRCGGAANQRHSF